MRFQRYHKHPYEFTDRNKLAIARRLRKEVEKHPLFAEDIAAGQPSVEEAVRDQIVQQVTDRQARRDQRAERWRRARARLWALPPEKRRQILHEWETAHGPGDPSYLLDRIHQHTKPEVDHG